MIKLTHYRKEVIYQVISSFFKEELKKAGIIYTEAPDLKHDVISYHHDGKDKFALISEGDGFETIYITDSIPLDCDWDALVADCEAQLNGKEPMEMRTKARLIVDTAYQNAGDKYTRDIKDLFMSAPEPTSTDIQLAIAQLGYSIDDLKKMDHHDIDAAFFNSICATK